LTTLSLAHVYIFQICKVNVKIKSVSIGSLLQIYIFTYRLQKKRIRIFTFIKIGLFFVLGIKSVKICKNVNDGAA
jgi:hypothetical protein